MGPESSSEYFNIDGTIRSTNTSRYLSINGDDATSYKTLTFANTTAGGSGTNVWALEGDTIITGKSSNWGRRKSPFFKWRAKDVGFSGSLTVGILAGRIELPCLQNGRELLAGLPPDRKRDAKRQDMQQLSIAASAVFVLRWGMKGRLHASSESHQLVVSPGVRTQKARQLQIGERMVSGTICKVHLLHQSRSGLVAVDQREHPRTSSKQRAN